MKAKTKESKVTEPKIEETATVAPEEIETKGNDLPEDPPKVKVVKNPPSKKRIPSSKKKEGTNSREKKVTKNTRQKEVKVEKKPKRVTFSIYTPDDTRRALTLLQKEGNVKSINEAINNALNNDPIIQKAVRKVRREERRLMMK